MSRLVLVLVLIFGGLVAYNQLRSFMMAQFFAHFTPPPVTISTVQVKEVTWKPTLESVGSFVATQGIEINSQVGGIVQTIEFQSGQEVKKGDELLVINDSVEQAVLKNNVANLVLQQLNYDRQINLKKSGSTAVSTVDQAQANLTSAIASVEQEKAIINQKHIVAPFDGRLGIRQVSLGQYITPGTTTIVGLVSLNPLYLQFYLPEQYLSQIYVNQPIQFNVEAYPNRLFTGKIVAIESKVETNTHNILLQAQIENSKENEKWLFLPGIFANIQVILPAQEKSIVLPLTAITYTLYGDSVYLVEKNKDGSLKVKRQFVKVGEKKGNWVKILSGVKVGDTVVSTGQMKLHNGSSIVVNNSVILDHDNVTED